MANINLDIRSVTISDNTTKIGMNKLIVNPHTVFMMVGPSTCGKTIFCTQYLLPKLPGNVHYLSSDEIRADLLGKQHYDHYSNEMTAISKLAFEQLFSRLNAYMTWPCCAEFIIIDSTGLNDLFRSQVANICQNNHYHLVVVLFDYKKYDDYYTYATNKSIVTHQIEVFRSSTLPTIIKLCSSTLLKPKIFHIKTRKFDEIVINVPKWDKYNKCFLSPKTKTIIIGNASNCYDEVILLLKQFKIEIDENGIILNNNRRIILLGSYTNDDKLINLIRSNNIICVNNDRSENSVPFISVRYRWIATAGFLEKKYLGKMDNVTCQRKIQYEAKDHMNESVYNEPIRIFGSCLSSKYERYNNLYAIDAGCVHGGYLIGLELNDKTTVIMKKQKALREYIPGHLQIIFPRELKLINPSELSPNLLYRYNKIIYSAAPFLSGTMSPAPANFKTKENTLNSFESLESALQYYKNNNVNRVCLQPKYMGSRCTVVLNSNEKSYAISRSGYNINLSGMKELLESLEKQYLMNGTTVAIIDGELVPWRAMGRLLIDNMFKSIEVGLRTDIELLKKFGFADQLNKLEQIRSDIKVPLQKSNINKISQYIPQVNNPQGLFNTLVAYDSFITEWVGIEEMEKGLDIYSNQLSIFSSNEPLTFKPFALLKTIDKDGEHIYDEGASENFRRVSTDEYCVVSVDELEKAQNYYNFITRDKQMEGIVIKPDISMRNCGKLVVPYMKVRNSNYLTLIYGPTYQAQKRLCSLIKRKNIRDKQKLSRIQYDISQEILHIPISELTVDNLRYCQLVATFIKSNYDEEKLDPRL